MRGYRNQDSARQKQKALPMTVLRKMHEIATSKRDQAVVWLLTGAIFFAMRSCEYLKTAPEESKRTKIIRVGNIRFKKGNSVVNHDHPNLHSSDLVRITFKFQKNDKRDVSIHMFRSGDKTLCPVIAWATTVKRVRAIQEASNDSPVCLFREDKGTTTMLTAMYARSRLRATVQLMGGQKLGFTELDIGLHSIRSGGAMAMFLSGVPVVVIMRVGRWSSDAFLEYIRDQIESFTAEVSKKMITCEDFVNLNMQTSQMAPQDTTQDGETLPQNENGHNSVTFNVHFTKLALGRRKRQQR